MTDEALLRLSGRTSEWHEVSYLEPERSHLRALIAAGMVLLIACIDLGYRSNYSILYVAPLVLLARDGRPLKVWRVVAILVALVYGVYFLKNAFNPPPVRWRHFDFRVINRTITAIMLLALGRMFQVWIRWREEQSDAELPESFRNQDQEISETFAIACCVPMVCVIALLDFLSPAHYNIAILYPVPLLICGWTQSRRLVWGTLAILLALAIAAFTLGFPTTVPNVDFGLQRNRLLAMSAMLIVAVALHQGMRQDPRGYAGRIAS
ncbi:MAG TPA: hypothetical protein VHV08_11005 [Pirellulales bacterium]|jgi:hypothetical protein|nr:hypothetical protein [Pirellulales bacterium]